jgi:hypothetical protein
VKLFFKWLFGLVGLAAIAGVIYLRVVDGGLSEVLARHDEKLNELSGENRRDVLSHWGDAINKQAGKPVAHDDSKSPIDLGEFVKKQIPPPDVLLGRTAQGLVDAADEFERTFFPPPVEGTPAALPTEQERAAALLKTKQRLEEAGKEWDRLSAGEKLRVKAEANKIIGVLDRMAQRADSAGGHEQDAIDVLNLADRLKDKGE